jgi:hypothetical protein
VGAHAFDTTGATAGGEAVSCLAAAAASPDVWFKHTWTGASAGFLSVDACGSPLPVVMAYSDCPAAGTLLKCNANARTAGEEGGCNGGSSLRSRVVVPASPGSTIWIRLVSGSTAGSVTSGTLNIAELAPAPNDSCANASPLLDSDPPTTFDTNLATNTVAEVNVPTACLNATLAQSPDVWFRYMATATGNAAFMVTDPSSGTGTAAAFRPVLSIYTGSPSACGTASIACTKSNVGGTVGSAKIARIVLPVTTGTVYYMRVAGLNAAGSAVSACVGTVQVTPPLPAPANDECSGAIDLTAGALTPIDTSAAGQSTFTSTACSFSSTNAGFDLWFRYVPSASGAAAVSTCGSPIVAKLGAFSSCTATTSLACGSTEICLPDGSNQTRAGWMRVPVTAGTPIFIRVAGDTGAFGPLNLTVTLHPVPANDACASALDVQPDIDVPVSTLAATQDRPTTCSSSTAIADAWYRYTPATSGVGVFRVCSISPVEAFTSSLTAYSGLGDLPCSSPELLSCRSVFRDTCYPTLITGNTRGLVRLGLTAGEPVLIRIGSASASVGTVAFLRVSQSPIGAGQWYEGNTDGAGELASSAQVLSGSGPLTSVLGNINIGDRADVYKIRIADPASFSATLASADSFVQDAGSNLFLFDSTGRGVDYQAYAAILPTPIPPTITNAQVSLPGEYYIAVSPRGVTLPADQSLGLIWNQNPVRPTQAPNGAGSTNPLADWTNLAALPTRHTPYTITLTGATLVPLPCAADFNGGGLAVQDIFDFLNAWFAGAPSADFNGGGLAVQDIFDFLNAWFAGCP